MRHLCHDSSTTKVISRGVPSAVGTAEEQVKNFQWGLRRSTLNHLMCMPFTDVAQVANADRNYEILHERDDDDADLLYEEGRYIEDNAVDENIVYGCTDDPNIPDLEEIGRFGDAEDDDSGDDMNNLDTYFQMDVKSAFLYGKFKEDVYVCQPPGFEDPDFPDRVYEEMCTEFEKMMHKKFQMSSMGELTFFLGLQVKQKEDEIFISQDKFQVNPKISHLHAMKRIFRYLNSQPKLGLWYPMDSPFDLVAYTDSDYARASLDRKSTTGGCQFLGCRLISCGLYIYVDWNEVKQLLRIKLRLKLAKNINGEAQIHAKVDGKKVIISEASIRRDLRFGDEGGIDCLPNETIFKQLTLMGNTIAYAVICLATNQKFNFSKYIFDSMVKHLDSGNKFLIYPRDTPLFPTMLVQAQADMGEGSTIPSAPQHTPPIIQPSTSKLQKKQKPRKPRRQKPEETQPSGPITNVADKALNKENVPTQSNDPPLSRVNTLGSGEDGLKLKELMELCTKLSERVIRSFATYINTQN
nr:retrotransposon protein, putative, unclassified [Tanacetum cinerariifolium]